MQCNTNLARPPHPEAYMTYQGCRILKHITTSVSSVTITPALLRGPGSGHYLEHHTVDRLSELLRCGERCASDNTR